MRWRNNLIYDGTSKITIEYSYGRVTMKSNGTIVRSDMIETEFTKMLPIIAKIDNNCYLSEYNDISVLVYKGKLKRLDKDIGRYIIKEDELPGL